MQPIVIIRHSPTEGPGYFATFLERNRIPWQLIAIDAGDPLPASPETFSGLALMGGPMSANDMLPWIEPACQLIRESVTANIPVLGHCLGGQLMSKALGATVTRNPVKEIGWSKAASIAGGETSRWLGEMTAIPDLTIFQWHGETFALPDGATHLLRNQWCENQAYILGPHLALQCHIEMTEGMIRTWCQSWDDEVRSLVDRPACVQTPEQMEDGIAANLPAMRQLADQLYACWIKGLRR